MTAAAVSNAILGSLPPDVRSLILGRCSLVRLEVGTTVQKINEAYGRVYFIESGLISAIFGENPIDQVEVALIGREGMVGFSSAFDGKDAPFRMVVQAAGNAYEISSIDFVELVREVPDLLRGILAFSHAFTLQVADTVRTGARHTVVSRLARWILMAHDRIDGDAIEITHETLSRMLGVRRPGVTTSLHILEGEHTIRSSRGRIKILDRDKLIATSKGAYRTPC